MNDFKHSEYQIFGPPGTGKTTRVAHEIGRAAKRYGSDNVVAISFTRAAAAEIGSRDVPLPRRCVGTLHSFCFRALGNPTIAESKGKEWNAVARSSDWKFNKSSGSVDDLGSTTGESSMLSRWNMHRSTEAYAIDPSTLPDDNRVKNFAKAWEAWKKQNGYVDFTDLIDLALRHIDSCPGYPKVGFVDEAQDLTPLELALVRKWGARMLFFVLVGDDDQCIYAFKGATPLAFLGGDVPQANKIFLEQSYRVPRAVHAEALNWTSGLKTRQPKTYLPREADGAVILSRRSLRADVVNELALEVDKLAADGKTVMILATCSYMLGGSYGGKTRAGTRTFGIIDALRSLGTPFHNPFRVTRSDWSPLRNSTRLASYLRPDPRTWGADAGDWSWSELHAWMTFIPAQGPDAPLQHGVKAMVAARSKDDRHDALVSMATVAKMFKPGVQWWNGSPDTLGKLWSKKRRLSLQYPIRVAERHGRTSLIELPRVIIGTIHSVKGGEADVVYVSPDLSRSAYDEYRSPRTRDRTRRVFYVAVTRARETLIKLRAASAESVW
jgi:DNA helicase-2/ATP-dependent DNA helicase PcrA